MRFRPSSTNRGQKTDLDAQAARAQLKNPAPTAEELVFNRKAKEPEIMKAENKAAGLPPNTTDEAIIDQERRKRNPQHRQKKQPESNEPVEKVEVEETRGKGIGASLKAAAKKVINKVTRLIRKKPVSEREIIINAESLETRIAILDGGSLEEFNIERTETERLVGSVFKGRIKNLEDGLKAAFVDIGFDKNAFLHYWDIVPTNFDSAIEIVERKGKNKKREKKITQRDIPKLYPPNSEIIVQVTKGPIGTKGPRITTNLSLPGRFLVLLPNSEQSGISRKIESQEERQRLKKILRNLTIPDGMGVVMRTAGEGKQARFFVRDLALLLDEWNMIAEKISKQKAPSCVYDEPDLIGRTVRDFLTEDVGRIVVDEQEAFDRISAMIEKISKRSLNKVRLYTETKAIFDRFGITRQLENTFSRQVHLKSRGYIVIDETEALTAIDVNTGKHKSAPKEQDQTIFNVNIEAAEEICRQLRFRNLGGLVILDFIDMKSRRDQQAVFNRVRDGLRKDKAKTHVLPISQLGLMEMTRQRHTESIQSAVYSECPHCKGHGVVKSTLTMSVEIQRKLSEILRRRKRDESDFQLRISVHPTVLERLRNEDEALLIEMEKKYFGKLSFRADSSLHMEHFEIVDVASNQKLVSVH